MLECLKGGIKNKMEVDEIKSIVIEHLESIIEGFVFNKNFTTEQKETIRDIVSKAGVEDVVLTEIAMID